MSDFVTKQVIEKKVINKVIDGSGPQSSYLSIVPTEGYDEIKMVFGASYSSKNCCYLSSHGLLELIGILNDVYDAMTQK